MANWEISNITFMVEYGNIIEPCGGFSIAGLIASGQRRYYPIRKIPVLSRWYFRTVTVLRPTAILMWTIPCSYACRPGNMVRGFKLLNNVRHPSNGKSTWTGCKNHLKSRWQNGWMTDPGAIAPSLDRTCADNISLKCWSEVYGKTTNQIISKFSMCHWAISVSHGIHHGKLT